MKKMVTALLFIGLLVASTVFAADTKIGYIDMQRAISTSEAGKEAKEQMAARLKKAQDEINHKQEDLKRLKEELEKQGMLLSESARNAKEKDYQQKLKEFQRFIKDAEDELKAKDEEFIRRSLESMEKVIQELGETRVHAEQDPEHGIFARRTEHGLQCSA
jgi:outer membrane protein